MADIFFNVVLQISATPNYNTSFVMPWAAFSPSQPPTRGSTETDTILSIVVLNGNASFPTGTNASVSSGLIFLGNIRDTGLNPPLPTPFQYGDYFHCPTGGGTLGGATVLLSIKRHTP